MTVVISIQVYHMYIRFFLSFIVEQWTPLNPASVVCHSTLSEIVQIGCNSKVTSINRVEINLLWFSNKSPGPLDLQSPRGTVTITQNITVG